MHATRASAAQRRPPQYRLVAQRRPDVDDWGSDPESLSDTIVLAEQLFVSSTSKYPECPETALMRAVLDEALACFRRGFTSVKRHARRLAREARAWFLSDDDHWLYSFVSVCAALGLEPSYIRREITQWELRHSLPVRGKPYRCVGARRQIAA
jgi:hypothetical protein